MIFAVVVAAITFVAFWVFENWATKRAAARFVDRAVASLADGKAPPPKLEPESQFLVEVSEDGVRSIRPDGKIESVAWEDLRRVSIVTTGEGPFVPDIFWLLIGSTGGGGVAGGGRGGGRVF